MNAFLPTGRTIYQVKVPTPGGAWVKRSTGLRDEALADAMQAMIDALARKRADDLLGAIASEALSVGDAFDAWRAVVGPRDGRTGRLREPSVDDRIDAVRALLNVHDLRGEVERFEQSLANKVTEDTAAHYASAVEVVFAYLLGCEDEHIPSSDARPVTASMLTRAALSQAFDSMNDLWSGGTVRKRAAGFNRFVKYLRGRALLDFNPMYEVELPPAGKPRTHHLTTAEAKELADAQPEPFRTFAALLAGTGIEVSVALALTRRDVDEKKRQVRAAGTKTHNRDRVVRVADWAWAYLAPLLDLRTDYAPLFPEIPDRWEAGNAHRAAVAALVEKGRTIFAGYTMRDHRHTYAVRAIRAGVPAELVARQLGHVDAVLVHRVYGRFAPTTAEREHWEQRATEQDKLAAGGNLHAREE